MADTSVKKERPKCVHIEGGVACTKYAAVMGRPHGWLCEGHHDVVHPLPKRTEEVSNVY